MRTRALRKLIILILSPFLLTACTTYYLPLDKFRAQLDEAKDRSAEPVTTAGPLGEKTHYSRLPIDTFYAVDKKGNPQVIPVGPAIEMRITDSAGRKTIFYADRLEYDGINLSGSRSRIISSIKRTIPFSSIRKIEIQNGRKNYQYTSQ